MEESGAEEEEESGVEEESEEESEDEKDAEEESDSVSGVKTDYDSPLLSTPAFAGSPAYVPPSIRTPIRSARSLSFKVLLPDSFASPSCAQFARLHASLYFLVFCLSTRIPLSARLQYLQEDVHLIWNAGSLNFCLWPPTTWVWAQTTHTHAQVHSVVTNKIELYDMHTLWL